VLGLGLKPVRQSSNFESFETALAWAKEHLTEETSYAIGSYAPEAAWGFCTTCDKKVHVLGPASGGFDDGDIQCFSRSYSELLYSHGHSPEDTEDRLRRQLAEPGVCALCHVHLRRLLDGEPEAIHRMNALEI
jgi:hypothetical protein